MPIRPCVFSDEVSSDFEEAVRLSAEAGAEGLELRGRMWGRSIGEITDEDARRILEVCGRHGVEVAVVGSPVGKCDPEDPEECRRHQELFGRMVALARAFGTDRIRAFALWRPGSRSRPDAERGDLEAYLPRVAEFLAPLVLRAEQEGVRYCLETEGATLVGTCAEARRVMDALGNPPALGLAWDVNNGLDCGETPYPDGYRLVRDRIYHVHVKPNLEQSLATVGGSHLTYTRVFEILRNDGYDGWASIEHWGAPELMLKGLRGLKQVLRC